MQSSSTCKSHDNSQNLSILFPFCEESQGLSHMKNSSNCTPQYLNSFPLQECCTYISFSFLLIHYRSNWLIHNVAVPDLDPDSENRHDPKAFLRDP